MTKPIPAPAPALGTPAARKSRKTKASPAHGRAVFLFIAPFGLLFLAFYAVPIFFAVVQSLLTVERKGTFGPPQQVFGGFIQYQQVFQNSEFWQAVGRVLLFGAVQVPIMLGLALLFALLLDSPLLRGKKFFRLAFFAPYAVPGVIAAIMWGFLYSPSLSPFEAVTSEVNFLSAELVLWAVANIVTWVYVGYNMLIIYSSLLAIPTEIYEAARLDGATNLQIAWRIKIPLVVPAIILTGVFSIIGTLQLLAEPQTLRSFSSAISSTFTPNLAVYTTASVPNYNLAAAFSVVLALATFVLSFVFLKATQRKVSQ